MAPTNPFLDAHRTPEPYTLSPHPTTGRLIDSHPGTRTLPMRVLVLGMSRTGTMSIFTALEKLNYHPYHMAKAVQAPKTNLNVWCEALRAKFHGQGKVWGREEFDKVLGNYDAVADVPCICFAEELIAAYPEAKVLLNERDVDDWLRSMEATAGVVLKWHSFAWLAPWDHALLEPFWEHAKLVMPAQFHTFSDFSPDYPAREAFHQHYARVRKAAPEERLLSYRVAEGWEPLCKFLGEEVPKEEFPRVNDARSFVWIHRVMWYLAFAKMVGKVALMASPMLAAVGLGVGWQRGGDVSLA